MSESQSSLKTSICTVITKYQTAVVLSREIVHKRRCVKIKSV